jgi:ribosome-associated protein
MMSPADDAVVVTPALHIPRRELRFTFSRSGGPGGQNVNKVNTRVTLHFDVHASTALSEAQKVEVRRALHGRVTPDGELRVTSSRHRTQAANRESTIHRFAELLAAALHRRRPRVAMRPTRSSRRAHRAAKDRRGEVKRARRPVRGADE